ncbi:hypothetical protein [Floridanema evergladense]|uniref:Uncharacterized protein n=1 Tax=Floridaenema evergladense BLCC-F167 TaxID=3153639 RepID=A0ABV4WN49_9CYAN
MMILFAAVSYYQAFNMAHKSLVKLPVPYALCYLLGNRDAIADNIITLQAFPINFPHLNMNPHAEG